MDRELPARPLDWFTEWMQRTAGARLTHLTPGDYSRSQSDQHRTFLQWLRALTLAPAQRHTCQMA